MSYITSHLMKPSTGTPSSFVLNPSFSEHKPCGDLRPQLSDALADPDRLQVCEPKQLTEDQDYKHFTEDWQLTEHEDLRVKPLSFHQSIIASTYDSAESIATPLPESDLDDEQLRALLASPLYVQEQEASAEHSQVFHSERENLMSSSSHDPIGTGKLVALFSSHNRLNQETFSDREEFSLRHQQVFGSTESFFTLSHRANVAKSLLDGNRDHLLA